MAWNGTFSFLATRTSSDSNSAADVNNQDDNLEQLWGNQQAGFGNGTSAPTRTVEAINTEAVTNTAKIASLSDGINGVINGNFQVWQRQVSFAAIADSTYFADRWEYQKSGAMVHTVTRDTSTPTDTSQYSAKVDCTTVDAAIAAADYCMVSHKIEGYNFARFVGEATTLSFWVNSTKTGTFCVAFRNSGTDRTYVAEYTVSVTNTWEKKTINVTFDYSGGTWDFVNGIGIEIDFVLAAGTNHHTTADAWQSTADFATSNQVNATDHTDNNFLIDQVQLNTGSTALDFNFLDFETELSQCQRYYEKTYDYDVYEGAADTSGAVAFYFTGATAVDYAIRNYAHFQVSKRSAATIYVYDMAGNGGTGGAMRATTSSGDNRTASLTSTGDDGIFITATNGAAPSDRGLYYQYAIDTEL